MPVPTAPQAKSPTDERRGRLPRIKLAATALLRHGLSPTALIRQRNTLLPACALSPALLARIFLILAQLSPYAPAPDSTPWSWLALTRVCTAWRAAALACPDLWAYTDFTHPELTALTLARTKHAPVPLHIRACVDARNLPDLRRTLQLAHRVHEITLRATVQDVRPLLEYVAHPNPEVRSITVDVHYPMGRAIGRMYDPPAFPTVGPPLLNLRYLELRGAPLYLLSTRCNALTQLHLHELPPCEQPSRAYFLSLLAGLPLLEHLTLDRFFPLPLPPPPSPLTPTLSTPYPPTPTTPGTTRLSLPHLRTLTLAGSVPDLADILDTLILPPSARLSCTLLSLSGLRDTIWRLTQAIGVHAWAAAEVSPIETLILTQTEDLGPRFLPIPPGTPKSTPPQLNPQFKQTLRLRAYRSDFLSLSEPAFDLHIAPAPLMPFLPPARECTDALLLSALTPLWRALPLTHVLNLAVQGADILTHRTWAPLLRALPSLRVLDIGGHAPAGLAWALLLNARACKRGADEDGGGEQGERLLLPRLKDIYLHGVDCSSGGYMVSPTPPPQKPTTTAPTSSFSSFSSTPNPAPRTPSPASPAHAPPPTNSHTLLDDSRFLDVLSSTLASRPTHTSPLRSLSISHSTHLLRRVIDTTRQHVGHVVWDGRGLALEGEMDVWCPARYRDVGFGSLGEGAGTLVMGRNGVGVRLGPGQKLGMGMGGGMGIVNIDEGEEGEGEEKKVKLELPELKHFFRLRTLLEEDE